MGFEAQALDTASAGDVCQVRHEGATDAFAQMIRMCADGFDLSVIRRENFESGTAEKRARLIPRLEHQNVVRLETAYREGVAAILVGCAFQMERQEVEEILATKVGGFDAHHHPKTIASARMVLASSAVRRDTGVGHVEAFGGLARLPEDVDGNAAAGIPIAADPQPFGLHRIDDPLADIDGAILVKGAVVSVGAEEQLEAF